MLIGSVLSSLTFPFRGVPVWTINCRITLVKASLTWTVEETSSFEAEDLCRCEVGDEVEDILWNQSVQGFENQAKESGLYL